MAHAPLLLPRPLHSTRWLAFLVFGAVGCSAPPVGTASGEAAREAEATVEHLEARGRPRVGSEATEATYPGVVLAERAVEVTSELQGTLAAIEVALGDRVAAGAPLALVRAEELAHEVVITRADLREAEAGLSEAETALGEVLQRLSRRQEHADLFPREELVALEAESAVASHAVERARARVDRERARLGQIEERTARSVLSAPFDGWVAVVYLGPGAKVQPATPILRLIGSNALIVRFAVPPAEGLSFEPGHPVMVTIAEAGATTVAVVSHRAPQVDGASGLIFVEAELKDPDRGQGPFRDSMPVRVRRPASRSGGPPAALDSGPVAK